MTKAQLEAELGKHGLNVVSVFDKGSGDLEAKIRWSDFKSFGTRKVNSDGSIFLDFGAIELGSITVHVDGNIIKEKTTGYVKDSDTVIFASGKATLVYKPISRFPTIAVALIVVVCVLVGIFVLLKKRGK